LVNVGGGGGGERCVNRSRLMYCLGASLPLEIITGTFCAAAIASGSITAIIGYCGAFASNVLGCLAFSLEPCTTPQ
jgi:hypothetical protein